MTDEPTPEGRADTDRLAHGRVDANTTYQLLQECWWRADDRQKGDVPSAARRELALAKTAIEDAQVRYARGIVVAERHGEPGHRMVDVTAPDAEHPA